MAPDRSRPPSSPLLGRDEALARLGHACLAALAGEGCGLLVVGPGASGRTSVLDAVVDGLPEPVRRLRLHGTPAEQSWGLAAVAEVAHRLRSVRPRLPRSLDDVLDAVTGEAGVATGPVAAAFTALVAEAASDGPLALVVDDVDALDADSRAVVATAARRLVEDPVVVLMTGAPVTVEELPSVPVEALQPLGPGDAARVVAHAAGRPVAPGVVRTLVDLAGGRPGVLVELARALGDDELAGRSPLSDPLPVGPLLEKGAVAAFEGLAPAALRPYVLLAVAGELDTTALRALLGPDGDRWLTAAEAAGTVVLEAGRARLSDGLARAALVHGLTPPARREAEAAVAALMDEADPRRTWHLAAAAPGPDDGLADRLAAEAERARRRGALVTSAAWWARAAELTGDPGERAGRALAAARTHLDAGHPGPVEGLLAAVAALRPSLEPGAEADVVDAETARVDAALLAAAGRVDEATDRAERAAALLARHDPVAAASLVLDAVPAVLRTARPDLAAGLVAGASALLAPAETGEAAATSVFHDDADADAGASTRARLRVGQAALVAARRGPESDGAVLDAAVALADVDPSAVGFAAECGGLALVWAERYAEAATLLDGLERRARAAAAPAPLATVRAVQAMAAMRRGLLRDAAVSAAEAVGASDEPVASASAPFAHSVLAVVEAQRGEAEGCRASARWLLERAAVTGERRWEVPARAALGLLALGEGRPGDAVSELWPLVEAPTIAPWVLMWEGDLVEALIRSGRTDEAARVLDGVAGRGTWASGRASAVRERLVGLLAPDPEQSLVHLRRASEMSRAAGSGMGRARSRLAEGQVLRRTRRRTEARVALDDARVAFAAMGAAPWARIAAAELAACGGGTTPTRAGGGGGDYDAGDPVRGALQPTGPVLTPQELQVARLVAGGASNREVAERLFVSVRTVESHLGRVYRKLGVRSRSDLAARAVDLLDGPTER